MSLWKYWLELGMLRHSEHNHPFLQTCLRGALLELHSWLIDKGVDLVWRFLNFYDELSSTLASKKARPWSLIASSKLILFHSLESQCSFCRQNDMFPQYLQLESNCIGAVLGIEVGRRGKINLCLSCWAPLIVPSGLLVRGERCVVFVVLEVPNIWRQMSSTLGAVDQRTDPLPCF